MNKRNSYILISLLVAITIFFVGTDIVKGRSGQDSLEVGVELGQVAPNFTLADTLGNTVSLEDYRGKIVMLNFWSMGCYACVLEMPDMQKLYTEFKDRGFEILAVNLDRDPTAVNEFMDTNGYTFKVLDATNEVAGTYRVRYIPKSLFMDPQGVIRYEHVGALNFEQLSNILNDIGLP